MARELVVAIDDELEREMSKYPEVDWAEVVRKAITDCIHCKEISDIYAVPVEKTLSQEK